jgi:hypothetical protein
MVYTKELFIQMIMVYTKELFIQMIMVYTKERNFSRYR